MKRTTLLFSMLLTAAWLFGQTNHITGRLTDDGGQPIAFATVVLKNIVTDSLVTGTSTGEDGAFSLVCDKGTYNLVASFVGYERLCVRCQAGDNLGTITMNAKQLESVTITASRTIENVDRFVVLPKPEEVESAGRTLVLLDMLGLPGLKVDVALQRITVDGGTAILKINGKEVPITRLANLRANQIKRVEYSNNPGTRYLDRGASGIINIILKDREDGGSIAVNGSSAVTTGFVNGYLLGSYHKGKSEFAVEYTLGYRNYRHDPSEDEDTYIDPARTVKRLLKEDLPFWYLTSELKAEYTYQHDDSTMFIASMTDEFYTKTLHGNGTLIQTDNGVTTEQTTSHSNFQKSNMPQIDLFYTHKLQHGQKLELNIVGTYSNNNWENTLTYLDSDTTYSTIVHGHGYALSGEWAYSKQFAKVELRTGLQYQHNFAENNYNLYNTASSMTKDNAYLYAEMSGTLGQKVGYSIGTGAKLFAVTDGIDKQLYLRNLCTARLQWRINQQLSLTTTIQYTPILPTLGALSPVFQQTDDVEGLQGNPNLKPSEQLRAGIMLRYTHPKGFYSIANTGFMHIFHPYCDNYVYDSSRNLFIHTYHNAYRWSVPYAYAEVGMKGLWKCLNLSLNGTYCHYVAEGPMFSHTRNNFTANVNAQFYWKGFAAGASFTLLPQWTLLYETYSRSEMEQTIYVQYRHKNLTAIIMWHCPFNPKGYRYETVGLNAVHPYHHTNWTVENGNMVALGLTWQMDFGNQYRKGQKTLQNGCYDNGMVK